MPYTRIEKPNDIAIVWLDQTGESVNKISPKMFGEFHKVLDQLENDAETKGAVLISGKKDTFIAGADLDYFLSIKKAGVAEKLSKDGNALLNRMAAFKKPIVAAIHGAALGGGMEVALACHYRIATDDPKTVLGQPEVKLGLLPGGGGTQRLPKLVGLQRALDIMLTGKNIYPKQARRMGLVDLVTHPYGLLDAAKGAVLRLAEKPMKRKLRLPLTSKILESTPPGRKLIYKKAKEMVQKQTQGNYPAPLKIIECVEVGLEKGFEKGSAAESQKFDELMLTPQTKQLINLFFAVNSKKKNTLQKQAREVHKIGILGAGLMGAGIASVSVNNGFDVVLKDRDFEALAHGEKTIWDELEGKTKKRILSSFERDQIYSRISGVIDYTGFRSVNMVVEAVFEDLDLKHAVLAETEAATNGECIFASNTSSLPIADIAKKAKRPQQIIGMHYFSPVPKMPLLEIIVTPKTAEWVTATAIEVGIKQGKTVIVVNDGPGFYTTRILAPMMNETLHLLEEGADIKAIDTAMKQFGFPVGPITLMDEVGIDVGAHVTKVMTGLFEKRGLQGTDTSQKMFEAGFFGRKNQKGFYLYSKSKKSRKKKEVNLEIYRFFGGPARKPFETSEIQERLSLMMVNEAAHCLQEGILQSPVDGDLGAVLGLGFPPFLGGPFRYIDSRGADKAVAMLEKWERKLGARFTPARILKEHAAKNKKFYE